MDSAEFHPAILNLFLLKFGVLARPTEIAHNKDVHGYVENRSAAVIRWISGRMGTARPGEEIRERIASKENYKQLTEAAARKMLKKGS